MKVKPNVTDISLKDIKVASSTIGTVNLDLLKAVAAEGLYDALGPLNTFLASQNITIPNGVPGIFEVLEPTLKFHNGFIELGLTPKFLPGDYTITPYVAPVYDYSMFKQSMRINYEGEVIMVGLDEKE